MAKHLPAIASVAIGVIPLFVLIEWFDVPRKLILGWGVLSYLVGVAAFKMPLYHFVVVRLLHDRLSHASVAIIQGGTSAISELGSAWVFFTYFLPELPVLQVAGFAAAAGAVEAVVLPFIGNPLHGTPIGEHAEEIARRSSDKLALEWMGVLERALACITHVAARGLVYAGVVTGNPIPSGLAVATFAALDGRAYYAYLEGWAFDNIRVLVKFYLYFACVAAVQVSAFLFFLKK